MDLRRWTGVGFVRRAPTESGEDVAIHITRMTLPHVLWWHSHIQPIIDRDPSRVDRDWNWLLYISFATLTGGILARRPAGYTIGIPDPESDRFIPCGLVQLVGRYPALDDNKKKGSFVWFLSTVPDEALETVAGYHLPRDRRPKRLGTITLDIAVTHSLNHHRFGRTALHADDEGGDTLLGWYHRRGMSVLPAGRKLPPGPRRFVKPSDGRYCYYTVDNALESSHALDALR
jgi:hypothetical protein